MERRHYLNASTHRQATTSHDKPRQGKTTNRRGANLAPPGYGAEEGGGGYPAYNARYENRK